MPASLHSLSPRSSSQSLHNDLQNKKKALFQSFIQSTNMFLVLFHWCQAFCKAPGLQKWRSFHHSPFTSHLSSNMFCGISFPSRLSLMFILFCWAKPVWMVLNPAWLFGLWRGSKGPLWRGQCSQHQMGLSDMWSRYHKPPEEMQANLILFFVHTLEKSGEKSCDHHCVGTAFSPQVLSEQILWVLKGFLVSPA